MRGKGQNKFWVFSTCKGKIEKKNKFSEKSKYLGGGVVGIVVLGRDLSLVREVGELMIFHGPEGS